MKFIQLTQNKYAIVEDEDYEYLNQWKWYYHNGYAIRNVYRNRKLIKCIRMHRLIMNTPDDMEVDHINGNRSDNRKANLRNCTHAQNTRNAKPQARSKSGFKGVSWNKKNKKWIVVARRNVYLGSFRDSRDAALVYDAWARKHYDEYAKLNFNELN
jgi:hypothetical protein